jgi:hypothetical protein
MALLGINIRKQGSHAKAKEGNELNHKGHEGHKVLLKRRQQVPLFLRDLCVLCGKLIRIPLRLRAFA